MRHKPHMGTFLIIELSFPCQWIPKLVWHDRVFRILWLVFGLGICFRGYAEWTDYLCEMALRLARESYNKKLRPFGVEITEGREVREAVAEPIEYDPQQVAYDNAYCRKHERRFYRPINPECPECVREREAR